MLKNQNTTKAQDKKITEVARDCDLDENQIRVEIAAGRWFFCPGCGYPTAQAYAQTVESEGDLCEGCADDFKTPTYSEPFSILDDW